MIEQPTVAKTCPVCGASFTNEFGYDAACPFCAGEKFDAPALPAAEASPDPDRPRWGTLSGIAAWLSSVALIAFVPVLAVAVWYAIQSARGRPVPNLAASNELIEWVKSPQLLLVQVCSTFVAHIITAAICWAVVTRLGKRPFWQSLGWNWAGRSVWYWVLFSGCVLIGIQIAAQLLLRVLPESEENAFAELLRSSQSVRIAVAALATVSAPFVEEIVHRGVLFGALRRILPAAPTVILVSLLFGGIHILQYWGAWVSIIGLMMLSLVLTIVRAKTRSVLPCVFIHLLNNAFISVFIVINKGP